jgi:esterase/lipase superfamily enzyme
LGISKISIPENHKTGSVERSGFSFYGIQLHGGQSSNGESFQQMSIGLLGEDDFKASVKNTPSGTALIFVPGFNTSFLDGEFRLAQIVFDTQYSGASILFSWPSAGAGITTYDYDRESAVYSRKSFLDLLKIVYASGVTKVFVVAHSMGNQIVVDALAQAAYMRDQIGKLSEVVLAAPDVDRDVFIQSSAALREMAGGITLYASDADKALLASKMKAQGPRAGQLYQGAPIVVSGIEAVDVTSLGSDIFELNHGVYAANRSAIGDISRIISTEIHPPNRRSSEIRPVPEGSLNPIYWRFPN